MYIYIIYSDKHNRGQGHSRAPNQLLPCALMKLLVHEQNESRVTSPPPHWDVCLYVCKKHSFFNYHSCIEKYLHTLFVHFFSLWISATITMNAAVSIYAILGSSGAHHAASIYPLLGHEAHHASCLQWQKVRERKWSIVSMDTLIRLATEKPM